MAREVVLERAKRFVQHVVRAFYEDEFVVVIDSLLRFDYATDKMLADQLAVPIKEMRNILGRLKQAQLVDGKLEKQMKYDRIKEKKHAEESTFYYVDYQAFIDIFNYRLDQVRVKVSKELNSSEDKAVSVCPSCRKEFTALDMANLDPTRLVCDKVLRKNIVCQTPLQQIDLRTKSADAHNTEQRLNKEMEPFLELVAGLSDAALPSYPLEGADEDTVRRLVPEYISAEGNALDKDGNEVSGAKKTRIHDGQVKNYDIRMGNDMSNNIELRFGDSVPPEKSNQKSEPIVAPSWFTSSATSSRVNVRGPPKSEEQQESVIVLDDAPQEEKLVETVDVDEMEDIAEFEAATTTGELDEASKPDLSHVLVSIGHKQVPISDVTEEMQAEMTVEELESYGQLLEENNML